MVKKIVGVIAGYIVMALFIFITFTGVYFAMGTDGAFQAGSYDVSMIWIVASIVLGIIAALLGGIVCALISKSHKTGIVLAAIVFVLGILMGVATAFSPEQQEVKVREGNVGSMEAMQHAKQPVHFEILL